MAATNFRTINSNSIWIFYLLWILSTICVSARLHDTKLLTREDIQTSIEVFSQANVRSFGQFLFVVEKFQLIVGSRDYIFRLSLEGLKKLEEAHWPAKHDDVEMCQLKGKSEEDCMNYIKVLLKQGNKLFACGTNAFSPECSFRDVLSLKSDVEYFSGINFCPYSPYTNSTALMTSQGDYYIASAIDFAGTVPVIFKGMGRNPLLRTDRHDLKWLNEANFVASYEIGDFTYYFFREAAVEFINCGKAVYSRVARICKNDQGGQHILREKFTTFVKARLNCSIPGNYPFYFNEIQNVYYIKKEEIFYATFTTPVNSIYGTAVCAYNMSSIEKSFAGKFKYQKNSKSTWEAEKSPSNHSQCGGSKNNEHFLDAEKYQLMNEAVQPMTSLPILNLENERLNQIVVDTVPTKHSDSMHVIFVATIEGLIRKYVIIPETNEACLIEKIKLFEEGSNDTIKVMKLLKDMNSLYIGTDETVLRIPVHRCERMLNKRECLAAMDPYCGWNEFRLACTTFPSRTPNTSYWLQEKTKCPQQNMPVDGGWSPWSNWAECSQVGHTNLGSTCQCQQRFCDSPAPANGGRACQGTGIHVANCTRDGHWTDWSAWSSCSQSCGLAVKSRRRVCGNPAPAFGGKMCIGPETDQIYCTSNPPCPASTLPPIDGHWSEWSTWEQCSALCGGGIQIRRRRCNSPPPQHGGKECIGCDHTFRFCNLHACPEVKKSTPWTPYMRVNQTKDGYFEQRLKFSCKANVPDDSMLKIGNMKKEERFCRDGSQDCMDSAFLNIDGGWSPWSPWSYCSVSCGSGVQYRERLCDNPKPSGGGSDCIGPARVDRPCNREPCYGLEHWEEWSVWSLCDDNQEQQRKRKCKVTSSPTTYCIGPTKEIRMCTQEQLEAAKAASKTSEDGIHAAHVGGSFLLGVIVGFLISGIGIYFYLKKRGKNRTHTHVSTQLIPIKPNTYVSESEWKNNFSKIPSTKIPLREATIKRNGSLRAQLQSDNF